MYCFLDYLIFFVPSSICLLDNSCRREPTSNLLPLYAAQTTIKNRVKVNFLLFFLCLCIFFCTFAAEYEHKKIYKR